MGLDGLAEVKRRYFENRMVLYAEEKGVKASARYFGVSPNTVRKWHRRYKVGGRGALEELSKAPKNCKRRIPEKQREKAIEIKRNIKTIGRIYL